jgi:hypothetical protein
MHEKAHLFDDPPPSRDSGIWEPFAYVQLGLVLTVSGLRVTLVRRQFYANRELARVSQAVKEVPSRGELFDGVVSDL